MKKGIDGWFERGDSKGWVGGQESMAPQCGRRLAGVGGGEGVKRDLTTSGHALGVWDVQLVEPRDAAGAMLGGSKGGRETGREQPKKT